MLFLFSLQGSVYDVSRNVSIYICYARSTDSDHPRILLCKPRIRMQSSRITQPNLGHPRQQTHDRSRTQTCAINCGFVDADGRAALHARSIVGLLPRVAEVWLHDPRSKVCMRDPRIIAQKLGSEVCAAKSSDGLNPYFAHNIYTMCTFLLLTRLHFP